jgi:hypothetical protein
MWIGYRIKQDKEDQKGAQIEKLQADFKQKRTKQKSLSDYT